MAGSFAARQSKTLSISRASPNHIAQHYAATYLRVRVSDCLLMRGEKEPQEGVRDDRIGGWGSPTWIRGRWLKSLMTERVNWGTRFIGAAFVMNCRLTLRETVIVLKKAD